MMVWMAHRLESSEALSLVPRSLWKEITLGLVSNSRVSVEELETDNYVSEALELGTLANAWHNVEAGRRRYKHVMTLPTRHPRSLTLSICSSTRLTT